MDQILIDYFLVHHCAFVTNISHPIIRNKKYDFDSTSVQVFESWFDAKEIEENEEGTGEKIVLQVPQTREKGDIKLFITLVPIVL